MYKRNRKGVSSIVLIIVGVFVLGGAAVAVYYIQGNRPEIEEAVDAGQEQQASQTTSDLPSLYTQAGLPVPNGTVTKKRQGRNLSDGVQVTWKTSDSIATVKAFFDTEMSSRGFTLPSVNLPVNEFSCFAIYKKDNKSLTLQVTRIGSTTDNKIHVQYHE